MCSYKRIYCLNHRKYTTSDVQDRKIPMRNVPGIQVVKKYDYHDKMNRDTFELVLNQ